MDNSKIGDSKNLLKFACDDLEALRSVLLMVDREVDWKNEREMLSVTARALDPIISDIQEAIEGIDAELKKEIA